MLSSLTCFGSSAWNSGWKPLNRVVRSSAGVVWPTGMVAPSSSRVPVLGAFAPPLSPPRPSSMPSGSASPASVPASRAR